ncbi:uncharacterized protein LOC113235666 [Hyposmocoma kahamanoa]|uniref:uncharacterized protein LOC113235666 n=1 Tax=Hyposmocoma kahamanoa TaxID=1477025 RepID=UPI000E6D9338|nr:uncharacterized protein LOC113235666 [Hyposmocoma kahamanoa]
MITSIPPPNMDSEAGPKDLRGTLPSAATVFLNIFNSITYMNLGAAAFCGFFTGTIIVTGPLKSHVFLCTFGYIIMMSLAVLTLSPHSGWTTSIKYSLRKRIHGAMQVIGAALAISGSALVMGLMPKWFSKSVHGIFGIMALACLCLSFVLGILNVLSSRMPSLERAIKIGHTFSGVFTLVFAFLSLIMGFDVLLSLGFNGVGILGMLVTAIAMIGVVTSALITALRRMCC